MMSVSGVSTGAARTLTMAEKVPGAAKVRKPEEEVQNRQMKPVMDKYVRSAPQEPSGCYWMGRDEGGQPKIHFDNLERAADAPKQAEGTPDAKKPGVEASGSEEPEPLAQGTKGLEGEKGKDEVWVCNTDKADHEIERLKKKKQELEQRLNAETDKARIKDLERQLARVEQELNQKDSDTYRKRNSTFTQLS